MADRQRKKFKDTKLGQFLRVKAPKVLDVVGDALPDEGVLEVRFKLSGETQIAVQPAKIEDVDGLGERRVDGRLDPGG